MKYSDADALPPCEFSSYCCRLLNDLDEPGDTGDMRGMSGIRGFEQDFPMTDADWRDEQLIEEMRAHLPDCPTCSATLTRARYMRSQQRVALRMYLVNAEAIVPATTGRIFEALQQEEAQGQPSAQQKRQSYMLPEILVPLMLPKSDGNDNGNSHLMRSSDIHMARLPRRWMRNSFAIMAIAALLFAVLGVFGQFLLRVGSQTSRVEGKSWPSVIIGMSLLSTLPGIARLANIYNVDTVNGRSQQLIPALQSTEDVQFEAVSPDGKDMLYHFSQEGHTIYTTFQMVKSRGYVAQVSGNDASNAIWMDDNRILVAHMHSGLEERDAHSGRLISSFVVVTSVHLLFYHAPFVYFQDMQNSSLFRSDLATGALEQVMPASAHGLHFGHCLLNITGTMLYCESQDGHDIYALNSDGTGIQALNRHGAILGFAPNQALLYLQAIASNYQVVRVGQTPQQDQVLMTNVAPGATVIGTSDAILAPDGHALVVQGSNQSDTLRGLWYDDLTTHTARQLMTYNGDMDGQLVGWDRMAVSASAPTPVLSGS